MVVQVAGPLLFLIFSWAKGLPGQAQFSSFHFIINILHFYHILCNDIFLPRQLPPSCQSPSWFHVHCFIHLLYIAYFQFITIFSSLPLCWCPNHPHIVLHFSPISVFPRDPIKYHDKQGTLSRPLVNSNIDLKRRTSHHRPVSNSYSSSVPSQGDTPFLCSLLSTVSTGRGIQYSIVIGSGYFQVHLTRSLTTYV